MEQRSWLRLVFRYRGTELPRTKYRILGVFLLACGVTLFEQQYGFRPTLKPLPFSLVGVALGVFLGFRNNAAYDRFWEGRKLWGSLVNTSRSFARDVFLYLRNDTQNGMHEVERRRIELTHHIVAFVHSLRMSLRDQNDWQELAPFLAARDISDLAISNNKPFFISRRMGSLLSEAYERGLIDKFHLSVLSQHVVHLTDIQGGCERIKNTPIPFSYTTLIHRTVAIYCFLLPFGIVNEVHEWTPVVVLFIAYCFFGIDTVGDEIEQPFGHDPNDLPLTRISKTIEDNLLELLGEQRPLAKTEDDPSIDDL